MCNIQCYLCSFQMVGWNSINSGNNSNRPANISNIKTNFAKGENKSKFRVGPTKFNPGPMLFKVVATAVKLVIRSFPSKDSKNIEAANIVINVMP